MATIVYCHAHPDDEASQTSGAMARAAAEGHRVVVVFATNGDHGEVAADRSRARPSPTTVGARPRRRPRCSGWPGSPGSGTPTPA